MSGASIDTANVAGQSSGAGSSLSFSVNIASDVSLLVVLEGNRTNGLSGPQLPASVTCNGVAMTQLPNVGAHSGSSAYFACSIWYLIAPPTGTQAIHVTYGAACSNAAIAVPCIDAVINPWSTGFIGLAGSDNSSSPAATIFPDYAAATGSGWWVSEPGGVGRFTLADGTSWFPCHPARPGTAAVMAFC